jgi:hypothetical protein
MLSMPKRPNMKPAEAAAQNRKSLWPLIIFGAAVGVTWSWMDPEGTSRAASVSLDLMHSLALQGFDLVWANMQQLWSTSA